MEGEAAIPESLNIAGQGRGTIIAGGRGWRFFASLVIAGAICGAMPLVADLLRSGPWWLPAVLGYGALFFVFSQLSILAITPAPRMAIRLPICATLWIATITGFFYLGRVEEWKYVYFWIGFLLLHTGAMALETLLVLHWDRIRLRSLLRFSLWRLIVVVTLIACGLGGFRIACGWLGEEGVKLVGESATLLLPFMGVHLLAALGPLCLMTHRSLPRRLLLWLAGVLLTVPMIWLAYWGMLWIDPDTSDAMFTLATALAVQQLICFTLAALPLMGSGRQVSSSTDGGEQWTAN